MGNGKIHIAALSAAPYGNHAEYFRNKGFEVTLTTSLNDLAPANGDIVLIEPVMGKPVHDLPGLILKEMPMLAHSDYRNRVAWGIYYWLVLLREQKGIKTFFLVSEAEQLLIKKLHYYKHMSFLTAPGNGPKEMLEKITAPSRR